MTAPTCPDIAAFLTAQLDRLEGLAKAAVGETWSRPDWDGATVMPIDWANDAIAIGERGPFVIVSATSAESVDRRRTARHIAQHDPAFVLADIAAKRAVVKMWTAYKGATRQKSSNANLNNLFAAATLAPVMCQLAAPFADQPGYRPEWAVGS